MLFAVCRLFVFLSFVICLLFVVCLLEFNSTLENSNVTIKEFQEFIYEKYYARDKERGTGGTFLWFMEEVGELASSLAGDDHYNKEEEFADVLAWLSTLANINGVDLQKAIEKYTVKGVEGFK